MIPERAASPPCVEDQAETFSLLVHSSPLLIVDEQAEDVSAGRRVELTNDGPQVVAHLLHLGIVPVRVPGPEKSSQSVSSPTGDDMHVQMRDTLADSIVDGHKGTIRCCGHLDGTGQELHMAEKGLNKVFG